MSDSKLKNAAAGLSAAAAAAGVGATAGFTVAASENVVDALSDMPEVIIGNVGAVSDDTEHTAGGESVVEDVVEVTGGDVVDVPGGDDVIIDNIDDIEIVYGGPEYFNNIIIDDIEDVYGGPVGGWGPDAPEDMIDDFNLIDDGIVDI